MHFRELCDLRFKLANGSTTPLLIPSFSSRGFVFLKNLYNNISPFITNISLVSAFDIYYGSIPIESAYNSDIVFVDSGGYENKISEEPLESYHDERKAKAWNFDLYNEVIAHIEPLNDIIIVSYDDNRNITLKEQIERATVTLEKYNHFSVDFLWKPEPNELHHNDPNILTPYIDDIKNFRCLGITDKELGASLYERCRKIVSIRSILLKNNCNIPIHIFGCLDPLNSFLFFLCGADVFDGLSWLRYSFIENIGIYMEQYSLLTGHYELADEDVKFDVLVNNVSYLSQLQKKMKLFATSFDHHDVHLSPSEIASIKSILSKIQISTEGYL